MKQSTSTQKLALGAILTAMVILLQYAGAFIHLGPFSISLVLVPIVIGAATCGAAIGAWLGLVFGVVVLLSGDAAAFLAISIPGTVVTVLAKGALCGLFSALVYRLFCKKNETVAIAAAALVCPVVNTAVFLLGCRLFFFDTIAQWAVANGYGNYIAQYMLLGLVGGNFLVELGINVLLCPVLVRLMKIRSKLTK